MKKVISVLIMLVILLSCVSCASVDNEQDTKTTTSSETQISNNTLNNESNNASEPATTNKDTVNNERYYPKHYEIELNMENYETYLLLVLEKTTSGTSGTYIRTNYRYRFYGALTYAYYENVVVVLENEAGVEQTVKLNAGGGCNLVSVDNKICIVKSVSGKVIFNI